MGARACPHRRLPRHCAAAPRRDPARREGLRRGAEASRREACELLRRAIRGGERRPAGREGAARRSARRVSRSARQGGQRQRRLPRECAHAAGGARRMRFSILLLAALAACSTPTGPQPAPLTDLKESARVRALWTARTGDAETFVFEPAFADGAVFTAARDGTVSRLDAASGRNRWRKSAGTPLSAGVGTDGRIVAVANEHGDVIALDAASGEQRWSARVSSEVIAPPAVAADLVLVRSIDNRVFAFGAKDGK